MYRILYIKMARENEGIFDDHIRIDALEDEVVKLRKMVESLIEQFAEMGVKQDQMESSLTKIGYQLENLEDSCGAARQREAWQRNRERDVNRRRRETETKLGGDHYDLAVKVTLLEEEQKSAAKKVFLIEEGQRNRERSGTETKMGKGHKENSSESPKNPQNPNPAPTTTSPASWNTYCCIIL